LAPNISPPPWVFYAAPFTLVFLFVFRACNKALQNMFKETETQYNDAFDLDYQIAFFHRTNKGGGWLLIHEKRGRKRLKYIDLFF
jgi:hypothetical protein